MLQIFLKYIKRILTGLVLLLGLGLVIVIGIIFLVMIAASYQGTSSGGNTGEYYADDLSPAVEAYRPTVEKVCTELEIPEYSEAILALMEIESGGRGNDPMQAAEGDGNNVLGGKFPDGPNGIGDPVYSIYAGCIEFKINKEIFEVQSAGDIERLKIAIQGYNYGHGVKPGYEFVYQGKVKIKWGKKARPAGWYKFVLEHGGVDGYHYTVESSKQAQAIIYPNGGGTPTHAEKWEKHYKAVPSSTNTTYPGQINIADVKWGSKGVPCPRYYQGDERWGGHRYEGKTIRERGCGCCGLAMAVTGLTGKKVLPSDIADFLNSKGVGTVNNGAKSVKYVCQKYSLKYTTVSRSNKKKIDSYLSRGAVILMSIKANGIYTGGGHYILCVGKDSAGYYVLESGRFYETDKPYKFSQVFSLGNQGPFVIYK